MLRRDRIEENTKRREESTKRREKRVLTYRGEVRGARRLVGWHWRVVDVAKGELPCN